jgi:hypothetical protein
VWCVVCVLRGVGGVVLRCEYCARIANPSRSFPPLVPPVAILSQKYCCPRTTLSSSLSFSLQKSITSPCEVCEGVCNRDDTAGPYAVMKIDELISR